MRVAFLALSAALLPALAWPQAESATPRYKLSKADNKSLEAAACLTPHGVKLNRSASSEYNGKMVATALCAAHDFVSYQPLHYQVKCLRKGESWDCYNTVEYLRAIVGQRELFLVAPRDIMVDAYGATKYLLENGLFEPPSFLDSSSVKWRGLFLVHVEPAGGRTVKIERGPQWLFVEAVDSQKGTTYREVAAPG